MATEGCPLKEPRWTPTVILTDEQERRAEREAMSKQTRRQRRRDRAAKRAETEIEKAMEPEQAESAVEDKRLRRMSNEIPPLAGLPANEDPLLIFDREKKRIGHVFRNWWSPHAGFIVGSGPSLAETPIEFLADRGICSIGINNAAGYARTSAMVCADPPEKFHHGIWLDPKVLKFVPHGKMWKRIRAKRRDGSLAYTALRVADCPSVIGYARGATWEPAKFLSHEEATWGRGTDDAKAQQKPKVLFSFFIALRLMHYLGVRRIYLIGVDFGMRPGTSYAFDQWRSQGEIDTNNERYRNAAAMCAELRPHLEQAGVQVFNTNPNSHLGAFPHIPLERAVADAGQLVPGEPFDLSGWYEKKPKSD